APARTPRLAEEIVQQIDAMRADVVERSTARLGRVEQPGAPSVLGGESAMAGGVGQHGFPNHALFQQLPGPAYLGVSAPIVSDTQRLTGGVRRRHHRLGFAVVHPHGLFAEHVPAGAKRLNRLRGVEEHGRGHIDGVDRAILERRSQVAENLRRVGLGLGGPPGEDTVEAAPRLSQDGRDHAPGCDVANSNHQPIQHRLYLTATRGPPYKRVIPRSARRPSKSDFQRYQTNRWYGPRRGSMASPLTEF